MSSPYGFEFATGFAWTYLLLLRRRTTIAVGPEALCREPFSAPVLARAPR